MNGDNLAMASLSSNNFSFWSTNPEMDRNIQFTTINIAAQIVLNPQTDYLSARIYSSDPHTASANDDPETPGEPSSKRGTDN